MIIFLVCLQIAIKRFLWKLSFFLNNFWVKFLIIQFTLSWTQPKVCSVSTECLLLICYWEHLDFWVKQNHCLILHHCEVTLVIFHCCFFWECFFQSWVVFAEIGTSITWRGLCTHDNLGGFFTCDNFKRFAYSW